MMLLTSLLFSGLLMTQADLLSGVLNIADKILGDLNQPPLDDPVYVFEVSTDAPVSDVKAALSDVTIRQSFKIIGENQYFFVVNSNDTEALRDLSFPAGSVVTQFPAEHMEEYLRIIGINSDWEENYDSPDYFADDAIITVFDWRLVFGDDVIADDFNSIMTAFGQAFSVAHEFVHPLLYAAVGSYPPRFIVFALMEENAIQTLFAKDIIAQFGGPAAIYNQIKHAVKI